MSRSLRVAAVQAAPLSIGDAFAAFADHVRKVVADTSPELVVYPELHCFGADDDDLETQNERLRSGAVSISDVTPVFAEIAVENAIWLHPGSIVERLENGGVANTALVFSPTGELVSVYRKLFPWRPTEPYEPGTEFAVFELATASAAARVGMSICYDAWWPEVSRQLAWMGAEVILNVVKTTTPDREQETFLARANSIVNQNFTVSVNAAGPIGRGRSLIVGPEGQLLAESLSENEDVLVAELALDSVAAVRRDGTAGSVVPWQHFRAGDAPIALPVYGGAINPATWNEHVDVTGW